MKVRAGWGKTGQQETGTFYPAFGSYSYSNSSTAQYQFGNNFYTLLRPDVYNPNLVWETTTTKNLGLDFAIFNNRISGSFDYFDKKSENLISRVPTWAGDLSNFNVKNVGIIANKGFEVNLNIVPLGLLASYQISPPKAFTIFLQFAKPIPVPSYSESECNLLNTSKTFS